MGEDGVILLFDLDGTLIDSTEAILESFHHAFDAYQTPRREDKEIEALIGYPLDIMFSRLGIEESKVWEYVATYKAHYQKISRDKTILLPFAKEAIERASKIATLGVVTTKTAQYSRVLLEYFGVMHHFDVLIGREDVEHPKPHKEPIEKALLSLHSDDDVWMIGDTKLDLLSAADAGVNAIGVCSGYDSCEVLSSYTEHIFSDALEAVIWLESRLI